jgi:hypothetical protein
LGFNWGVQTSVVRLLITKGAFDFGYEHFLKNNFFEGSFSLVLKLVFWISKTLDSSHFHL